MGFSIEGLVIAAINAEVNPNDRITAPRLQVYIAMVTLVLLNGIAVPLPVNDSNIQLKCILLDCFGFNIFSVTNIIINEIPKLNQTA